MALISLCSLIWIAIFTYTTSAVCKKTERIRKAWHSDEAEEDRQLFIDGYLELSNQRKLQQFTIQHASSAARQQGHDGSGFLPWHRYFLWEFESQIRDLGGKYECFSLPYWDWTYELSRLVPTRDFHILNSGLGRLGDPTDDNCINDGGPFSKGNYEPYRDCPPQNNNGNCCLKRAPISFIDRLQPFTKFAELFARNPRYSDFREKLEREHHDDAHVTIGGSREGRGHLRDARHSPDDPIFFLLHAFVDYIWSLWQDCYNYELLEREQLTPEAYEGSKANTYLPDPLNFDILASNGWARIRPGGAVIRKLPVQVDPVAGSIMTAIDDGGTRLNIGDMHNIAWWDVEYEHDYLYDAVSDWFVDEGIFNCNNLEGVLNRGGTGRFRSFAHQIWAELTAGLGNTTISRATAEGLFKSLARINCEMRQSRGGRALCKRPKCFDDCSDMITCDDHSGRDINVTLDELIEKVQGYPCMIETRRIMYDWAKQTGNLMGLCRGDYDNFCDKDDIQGQTSLDTCPVSERHAEDVISRNNENADGSEWGGDGYGRLGPNKMRRYSAQNEAGSVISEPNKGSAWNNYDEYVFIVAVAVVFNLIAYGATYLYYINKTKKKIVTKY